MDVVGGDSKRSVHLCPGWFRLGAWHHPEVVPKLRDSFEVVGCLFMFVSTCFSWFEPTVSSTKRLAFYAKKLPFSAGCLVKKLLVLRLGPGQVVPEEPQAPGVWQLRNWSLLWCHVLWSLSSPHLLCIVLFIVSPCLSWLMLCALVARSQPLEISRENLIELCRLYLSHRWSSNHLDFRRRWKMAIQQLVVPFPK